MSTGIGYLVGAGPGDLGLVTLRAKELIERAEVLVYDYLVNAEMLRWAPADAEVIYAGKKAADHALTQDEINALLVDRVRAGKRVVRLKGGDPFVFGRGGEEAQALVAEGLAFEIVPGITSAIGAPAYAGIPVTHRDLTSTVTFITGHEDPSKEESALDWRRLAQDPGTRIFLMGVGRLRRITEALMAECADPTTPVALVRWGTTTRQETVEGTLATIADIVEQRAFKAPAIIIVGQVARLRGELAWFEKRPLAGQRIVVTRTRRQASALTARLRELGADVMEIPTIRIQAVELDAAYREKARDFAALYDWLVFTSPNGVDHFFDFYFAQGLDIRALHGVKIAAVGPATAAKVKALHLGVDVQPRTFTTEALAEAFPSEAVSGQRFCLARGDLANPALSAALTAAGGAVDEWTIYQTVPETADPDGTRARFEREGADWITFTSSSTVENWHALGLKPAEDARTPRHLSIGPVTSETLRRLHMDVHRESAAATIDSMVEAICDEAMKPSVVAS